MIKSSKLWLQFLVSWRTSSGLRFYACKCVQQNFKWMHEHQQDATGVQNCMWFTVHPVNGSSWTRFSWDEKHDECDIGLQYCTLRVVLHCDVEMEYSTVLYCTPVKYLPYSRFESAQAPVFHEASASSLYLYSSHTLDMRKLQPLSSTSKSNTVKYTRDFKSKSRYFGWANVIYQMDSTTFYWRVG
jgi:hypothetical protein